MVRAEDNEASGVEAHLFTLEEYETTEGNGFVTASKPSILIADLDLDKEEPTLLNFQLLLPAE